MRMAGSLSDVGRSDDRLEGGKMILDRSPARGRERIPAYRLAILKFFFHRDVLGFFEFAELRA